MKKLIWPIAFVLAFAIPVYAQQAQEFNLKVTNQDVDVIGKALGKLPFDEVASVIQKLREQIVAQNQAAAPRPVEEKKN